MGGAGRAAGIPKNILVRGGGWAQNKARTSLDKWGKRYSKPPYGDDPKDQEQMEAGINYYEEQNRK